MMQEALWEILIQRGDRVPVAERQPTNRQVCEGFMYSEHITRCTVRWTVWGLEVVVRDQKVPCVQALGTIKHDMNI